MLSFISEMVKPLITSCGGLVVVTSRERVVTSREGYRTS